jgi:hypothetical protein
MEISPLEFAQRETANATPHSVEGKGIPTAPFDLEPMACIPHGEIDGQIDIGMPPVAQERMQTSVPPPTQGWMPSSAPLHPAIVQAQQFLVYFASLSTPAGQSSPPPLTSWSSFIQRTDITKLKFTEHHKNILRQYAECFQAYEDAVLGRI